MSGNGADTQEADVAAPSHTQMTIQVLERTPRALRVLLYGLDAAWANHPYQETGFSPYNVVGHLLTLEPIDWIPPGETLRGRLPHPLKPDKPIESSSSIGSEIKCALARS